MFGLGVPEIIVIGIIVLLVFGAKRLPGIGESLGKTVKELRNVKKEVSAINKAEAGKKDGKNNGSEEKKENAGGGTDPAEGPSSESDIFDTLQKKVTRQVSDKLIKQIPGVKQARQLKELKDKVGKIE